jgi:hypothetical protein
MFGSFLQALRQDGVHKPVWNTEMNHGAPLRVFRKHPLTQSQQAAWVIAFSLVRAWMSGGMRPCTTAKDGTYACAIHGSGVVMWNPDKAVTVTAPKGTRGSQTHLGQRRPAKHGQRWVSQET